MAEGRSDWGVKWDLLVADAWADPALKERLLADPATVLKERGIEAPQGKTVKVVETQDDECTFYLPPKPAEGELSEEELATAAGGRCCCSGHGGGGGGHYCGGGGHYCGGGGHYCGGHYCGGHSCGGHSCGH